MLPCTAPPPPSPGHHPPLCALLHLPLLPLPAPAIHSSSHTAPSVSCAITTHILPHLLFGSPCHLHGLWTPLSLPCLLQNLHFPWGPLLPHPFRLQLSPGSPPPLGPPPCLLSLQLLPFHSLHIPVPCGPFSGRNGTTAAPGRAGESKEARAHQEREESEVVRGQMGSGAWGSRSVWRVGEVGTRAGGDGDRRLG